TGNAAVIFIIIDTLLTVVPLMLITWVLYLLFKKTYNRIAFSNIILAVSFACVWGIIAWKLNNDLNSQAYQLKYQAVKTARIDDNTKQQVKDEKGELLFDYVPVTETTIIKTDDILVDQFADISTRDNLVIGDETKLHSEIGNMVYLTK